MAPRFFGIVGVCGLWLLSIFRVRLEFFVLFRPLLAFVFLTLFFAQFAADFLEELRVVIRRVGLFRGGFVTETEGYGFIAGPDIWFDNAAFGFGSGDSGHDYPRDWSDWGNQQNQQQPEDFWYLAGHVIPWSTNAINQRVQGQRQPQDKQQYSSHGYILT